MQEVDA